MDLREALMQLDGENDSHWTSQDLPKVEIVQSIAEDSSISRTLIEEAAPGLTRVNIAEYEWPEAGEEDTGDESLDEVAALRLEHSELQAAYNEKDAQAEQLRQERDAIKVQMEAVDARIAQVEPNSFAVENRRYLDTQNQERLKRAAQGDPRTPLEKSLQNVTNRPGTSS